MLAAEGVNDLKLTLIWEDSEFAGDARSWRPWSGCSATSASRAELKQFDPGRQHQRLAAGRGRRLGRARQRLRQPDRPGHHQAAGPVRRHRGQGEDPRHLPGVRLPRGADPARPGVRRDRRGPPHRTCSREAQEKIWDTWPCHVGVDARTSCSRAASGSPLELAPVNSYDLRTVRSRAEPCAATSSSGVGQSS